jgi:transposase
MKFVPIKQIEQQDVLLTHRCRELAVKQRTALANQIRGLLLEYGVIIARGISQIKHLPTILDLNKNKLTDKSPTAFKALYEQFKNYENKLTSMTKKSQSKLIKM